MINNDPKMLLVTGEHCITPDVRAQIDNLLRDPLYRTNFSAHYIEFSSIATNDTWNGESYIMYDGDVPVGLLKPSFDRANKQVTNILPRVFPEYRGMGYASYMFAWVIDKYFKQGFEKICTCVWGINTASLALNRKFLIEEAVRPRHQLIDGKFYNTHLFGLIKRRYEDPECGEEFSIRSLVRDTFGRSEGIEYPER